MKFLVLNSGSGSQRCTLFDLPPALPEEPLEPVWEGKFDSTDPEQPAGKIRIMVSMRSEKIEAGLVDEKTPASELTRALLSLLWNGKTAIIKSPAEIAAIGHRIVHGGIDYDSAQLIDSTVEKKIDELSTLSPLHNPANLRGYRIARELIPDHPHFAVFDTAFHRTLPREAFTYAGPREWLDQGIRKYGFHGTSFRWSSRRAAKLLDRKSEQGLRLIVCHLGGGCSLCAIRDGVSVDTTMGFTPLDGIAMCTRSGAVDPGILIYLQRRGLSADSIERLLNKESGLKGLSGNTGDTRILRLLADKGDDRARLAIAVFEYRLRAGIGQMLAALGAIPDAIVFTDAMSEDAPAVRAAACDGFGFLDLELDVMKNLQPFSEDTDLATRDSRVRVLLIRSREAWQIARECHPLASKIGRQR